MSEAIIICGAIMRGSIMAVQLHKRMNLIPRSEIERYRRERLVLSPRA